MTAKTDKPISKTIMAFFSIVPLRVKVFPLKHQYFDDRGLSCYERDFIVKCQALVEPFQSHLEKGINSPYNDQKSG